MGRLFRTFLFCAPHVKTKGCYFKDPPKYEYGYNIADEKGAGQGKLETREGVHALGQ